MKKKITKIVDRTLLALDFKNEPIYNVRKKKAQQQVEEYMRSLSNALVNWLDEIDSLYKVNNKYLSNEELHIIHENFRLLSELRMHLLDDSIMVHAIMEAREHLVDRHLEINQKLDKVKYDLDLDEQDLAYVLKWARQKREEG